MRLSARPVDRAAADGVVTPIRSGFEEVARRGLAEAGPDHFIFRRRYPAG